MSVSIEILLLEDSVRDVKQVEHCLKDGDFDFNLTVVSERCDYVDALEKQAPDLVLSKYQLNGFSGLSAYLDLKDRDLNVPFILLTNVLNDSFAAEIAKIGFEDYLLKDRLSRLPIAVKNCLRLQ